MPMKTRQRAAAISGYMKCGILLMILFVPALYIANNLWFGGAAEDTEQLDDDYIAEFEADDPRLIEHIRKHYLVPPASRSTPYNLDEPNRKDYSFKQQSGIVADILHNKRNGFFLEAGGYDGEQFSNTLYLEKSFNWTGILVEPDPANIKKLLAKNLFGAMFLGTLERYLTPAKKLLTMLWRPTKTTTVWCFPFYSILLAVDRTKFDYMSLDIEGGEMELLRAIPWDKVDISVIHLEYIDCRALLWNLSESTKRREEYRKFFRETLPAYKEAALLRLDILFAKTSIL